jgi:hypothetical protein
MATGVSNKLTQQVGEYLVAAELVAEDLLRARLRGMFPDISDATFDAANRDQ